MQTPIPAPSVAPKTRWPKPAARNIINATQMINALAYAAEHHASGRLVDIGCGIKPYEPLFAPYVTEHVGVDHESSPHALNAEVLAEAYAIPLADGSFQTVLMSEVLEHLEEPAAALAETHRLLSEGGKLILTAPMIWHLHEEPRDFFRYTPHGLRYLLEGAGFVDIEILPVGGQWATLTQLSAYALWGSSAHRAPRTLNALLAIAHRLALRLDRHDFKPWMSYSHLAVATRREDKVDRRSI